MRHDTIAGVPSEFLAFTCTREYPTGPRDSPAEEGFHNTASTWRTGKGNIGTIPLVAKAILTDRTGTRHRASVDHTMTAAVFPSAAWANLPMSLCHALRLETSGTTVYIWREGQPT